MGNQKQPASQVKFVPVKVQKVTPPAPSPNRPALGPMNVTPPKGHDNGKGPNLYHGDPGTDSGSTDHDISNYPVVPIGGKQKQEMA